jgi:hypothetical protein
MDPLFSEALRAELVARVDASPARRPRKHRRLWLGIGAVAGVGLLGTAAAVAGGMLPVPGGQAVTGLAAPVTETRTGTATVDLGPAPDGVTNVALQLRCLTAGTFLFPDGASIRCSDSDANSRTGIATYSLPLAPGRHTITIRADSGARWQLTATYVKQKTTAWGVNADGNSYGIQNENGVPDLIAVSATNGRDGYVTRADLDAADGTEAARHFTSPQDALRWQEERKGRPVSIPVYEADGKTVIGSFVIGPG